MIGHTSSLIKSVVFDIDGVLIDSRVAIRAAVINTFKAFGFDIPSTESVDALYWATDRMIFETLLPSDIPNRHEVINRMVEVELDLYENRFSKEFATVGTSVTSTLEELRGMRLRLGIVTNNLRRTALKILSDFGLLGLFDAVVAADDVIEAKPSPKPLIEVCGRLTVDPQEAAYVGDSSSDVIAGERAGVVTILLDKGGRFEGKIAPDYKIASIEELLQLPIWI
jgi:HAD superfamily hydrolase (TIGR01549 family)